MFCGFIPFCLVELGILHMRNDAVSDAILAFDRALDTTTQALTALSGEYKLPGADAADAAAATAVADAAAYTAAAADSSAASARDATAAAVSKAAAASPGLDDCSVYRRWHCLQIETKKHYAMALKCSGDLHSAGVLFCGLIRLFREGRFKSRLLYSDVCFHLAEILNSQGLFRAAEPIIRECVAYRRLLFLGSADAASYADAAAAAAALSPTSTEALEAAAAAAAAALPADAAPTPGVHVPTPCDDEPCDGSLCTPAEAAQCALELAKDVILRDRGDAAVPLSRAEPPTSTMEHLARASMQQASCSRALATAAKSGSAADAAKAREMCSDDIGTAYDRANARSAGGSPGNACGPCPEAFAASSKFSFGSCPRIESGAGAVAPPAASAAASGAAEVAVTLCMLGATIAAPEIGKYAEAEQCLQEAIGLLENACSGGNSGVCDERSCMVAILDSIRAAKKAAEENSQSGSGSGDGSPTSADTGGADAGATEGSAGVV
jgi:hypothetical protein